MRGGGRDAADQQRRHQAEPLREPAAGEGAADADPDAVELRDGRDIRLGEAEVDVERVGHHAGHEIGQPVDRDQRQDRDQRRRMAPHQIGERLDERGPERRPNRARRPVEPRRDEAGGDSDQRQGRHREIGDPPARPVGEIERAGAGADHREPIAEAVDRRHHPLAFGRGGVDAPAVDRHVLGRRGESGGEGEGRRSMPAFAPARRRRARSARPRRRAARAASRPAAARASRARPGTSKRSMKGAQRNLNEKASAHQLISPMSALDTPASRNQADCVEKISRNGRPEE